ncbi:MAG: TolC family protein [Paludibacter sp.]
MNRLKLILVLFLFNLSVFAQTQAKTDSLSNVLTFDNYIIPELDECIQSTLKNSPLLKASDQQIEIILEDIKIRKKSWLEYLIIDANTRYGLFNQLTLTQETSNPDVAVQSAKEQFNYFAGLTLRIPLSYFSSNKNEQKKLNISIKEAELKKEELKNEINKLVVTEYFKLKRLQELLGVHLNNLQTAQIDYLKSKNDLKSGMLGMTEFAASSTAHAKAVDAFVSTKNDYYAQFYILNILMGTNIQKIKK